MISNETEGTMTRSEAAKWREELMSNRIVFQEEDTTYFGMAYTIFRGD